VILPDLQGKGHVRQRSISADLIIHLLFVFIGVHEITTLSFLLLFDQANGEALLSTLKKTNTCEKK
jgi:hypothetical protein